ncbi:CatA-like O-acetyltransferase, partial [Escherichia coli]
ADRNRSHWSTSKTPSYTKSVSWQHHPLAIQVHHAVCDGFHVGRMLNELQQYCDEWQGGA